jgi:pimeloyl-ACP methyl ester carboxylesterase
VYQELDVEAHRAPSPSTLHSMTELPRVFFEATSLAYMWPLLGQAPRGDGHAVLVLPGFTAGDESTAILRRFLGRLGYRALPWELGQNTGSFALQERLIDRFEALTRVSGERLSLVGQSLGGVYARELARRFAPHVRQVISLGSPFASKSPDTTNSVVSRLFQYMSGMSRDDMRDYMLGFAAEPPPVPSTAIYSKADGVVHWQSCLEYAGAQAENVEVLGSHTGMAMNPLVFHVLADRLAQADGQWRPFQRQRGCRALVYPEPAPTTKSESTTGGDAACAN